MTPRAAVYVTVYGGGAVTASFLPRGGYVQIYYEDDGGIESDTYTGLLARLDWDFSNNLGYLHTHWTPYVSREKSAA